MARCKFAKVEPIRKSVLKMWAEVFEEEEFFDGGEEEEGEAEGVGLENREKGLGEDWGKDWGEEQETSGGGQHAEVAAIGATSAAQSSPSSFESGMMGLAASTCLNPALKTRVSMTTAAGVESTPHSRAGKKSSSWVLLCSSALLVALAFFVVVFAGSSSPLKGPAAISPDFDI